MHRYTMHYCVWPIINALLLPALVFAAQQNTPTNQMVAEVNGKIVTNSELQKKLDENQIWPSANIDYQFARKEVLDKMIDRVLLFEDGVRTGTGPTNQELDDLVTKINPNTTPASDSATAEPPDAERLREDLKIDATIARYLQQSVFNSIEVSESELTKYYAAHPEEFRKQEEVRARHIFFKLPPHPTDAEITATEEKAQVVLGRVKGTSDLFETYAKKYSDAPTRARGGDLGYFSKNQMPDEFSQVAFALAPGQVSDLIRTSFGFHIVKVEDKRGGEKLDFSQVRGAIKERVIEERKVQMLAKTLQTLRQKAKIIIYIN